MRSVAFDNSYIVYDRELVWSVAFAAVLRLWESWG